MEGGAVVWWIAEQGLMPIFHTNRGQGTLKRGPRETGYGSAWREPDVNEHLDPMLLEKQKELREPPATVAQAKDSGAGYTLSQVLKNFSNCERTGWTD